MVAELSGRVCQSDDDCVDGHRCRLEVCLTDAEHPPVDRLLTETCPRVIGEDVNGAVDVDDVVDATRFGLVGVLLPLTRGGVVDAVGLAREEAAGLALTEINRNGGVHRRTLVGLSCNSDADVGIAAEAALHLAEAGVPVVVGEQSSSTTLATFTEVLFPAGVMMVAPSATSVDLTPLRDNGLLVRTTVADDRQGQVLGEFTTRQRREHVNNSPTPEERGFGEFLVDEGFTSVALISVDDSYGQTLADATRQILCASLSCSNPNAYFRATLAPNADAADVAAVVDDVLAMPVPAQAVVMLGQAAQVRPLVEGIGAGNLSAVLVVSDAARRDALFDEPTPLAPAIANRVLGTAPAQRLSGTAFEVLRGELSPQARDQSFVAHAYDAAIVAGLVHAASPSANHPTGAVLSAGLARLTDTDAPLLHTIGSTNGTRDVAAAIAALEAGDSINLEGTSGPLDFDAAGDVSGDIELWRRCLTPTGLPAIASLGVALSAGGDSAAVDTDCRCEFVEVGCAAGEVCVDGDCE